MDLIASSNYFDLMNKCQKAYGTVLEPVCKEWDLTRCELDVMLFLYNNPSYDRAADIVSRRGIAKSHVSLSVNGLEKRGLLMRCFSESDRRTAHLKLTGDARSIAAEARAIQKAFFSQLHNGITSEELRMMQNITLRVCENIENLNQGTK